MTIQWKRILQKIGIFCFLINPLLFMAQETKLISFDLRDQYKNEYNEKSWQDSVVVFLASNREGNKFNQIWSKAIEDYTKKLLPKLTIKQMGIANLKGAPFFMKGFIRSKMPADGKIWILMDWKGVFANAYSFVPDKCNLLIFDKKRKLLYQTSVTEVDDVKLKEVLQVLKKLNK